MRLCGVAGALLSEWFPDSIQQRNAEDLIVRREETLATGLNNKLTGQIGEHLVTAELGRRGIVATPFAGNVPDIDILAHANGVTGHIQVKAINGVSWQFDIRRFLNVTIEHGRQKVLGPNESFDKKIICIFVALGPELGADEFYIFRYGWLQNYWIERYNGRKPPKNINSFHCAIWKKDLAAKLSNWRILERKFKLQ